MSVISSGISEKDEISQIELMFLLFEDFLNNDVNIDFGFDNGLVCRWLNGTAKVSPQIISYYAKAEKYEALAFDIQKNILPLLPTKRPAVERAAQKFSHKPFTKGLWGSGQRPETPRGNTQKIPRILHP